MIDGFRVSIDAEIISEPHFYKRGRNRIVSFFIIKWTEASFLGIHKDNYCWCCAAGITADYVYSSYGKGDRVTLIGYVTKERIISSGYKGIMDVIFVHRIFRMADGCEKQEKTSTAILYGKLIPDYRTVNLLKNSDCVKFAALYSNYSFKNKKVEKFTSVAYVVAPKSCGITRDTVASKMILLYCEGNLTTMIRENRQVDAMIMASKVYNGCSFSDNYEQSISKDRLDFDQIKEMLNEEGFH